MLTNARKDWNSWWKGGEKDYENKSVTDYRIGGGVPSLIGGACGRVALSQRAPASPLAPLATPPPLAGVRSCACVRPRAPSFVGRSPFADSLPLTD